MTVDLMGQLFHYAKTGADLVVALIDRSDKRAQTKLQKDRKAEAAKAKAIAKQLGRKPSGQDLRVEDALFTSKHACVTEMQRYENVEEFAQAKKDDKHNGSKPHTIADMASLRELARGRTIKAAMGIFRIRFPASEARKDGGGQEVLAGDKVPKLREALLEGASDHKPLPAAWKNKPAEKVFQQVALYATTSQHPTLQGWERQGLASCRYQETGTREILAICVKDLLSFAADANVQRDEGMSYKDFLDKVLDALRSALDGFKDQGGVIYKTMLRPMEFCYMPMGYYVLERTVGDVHGYGYRTAAYDNNAENLTVLELMKSQMEAAAGQGHSLVRFWKLILDAKVPKTG